MAQTCSVPRVRVGLAIALTVVAPSLLRAGETCPLEVTYPQALNSGAASDTVNEGRPRIVTDEAGNWIAVWMTSEFDDVTWESEFEILVARSTDNGANWTQSAVLSPASPGEPTENKTPRITTHGGIWIVTWNSDDDLGGTIGDDRDILFVRSTDGGVSWSDPQPLNTNAGSDSGSDYFRHFNVDREGNWLAVWTSRDDLGGTIGEDVDILAARSTDGGMSWTDPQPLNTNADSDNSNDSEPKVVTNGQGDWVAVWRSADDMGGTIGDDWDIFFARSSDGWANWTAPQPLNNNAASDSGSDWEVALITDGQGHWVAVWTSEDDLGGTIGEDRDLLFARSTDAGASWTDPHPLNSNAAFDSGNDVGARLTMDGAGNWVAAWISEDDLGGSIGQDQDVLFVRSTDAGASWTDPEPLNSNAAYDNGDDSTIGSVVVSGGKWLALWYSQDDLGGTIGDDIDNLFAVSSDGGASWTAPASLNTNADSDDAFDGLAEVATDDAGNWLAVWTSRAELGGTIGTDFDLLFARFQLGDDQKTTICHLPPGNSDNAHTLTVGAAALDKHLAHGDFCGACECSDDADCCKGQICQTGRCVPGG